MEGLGVTTFRKSDGYATDYAEPSIGLEAEVRPTISCSEDVDFEDRRIAGKWHLVDLIVVCVCKDERARRKRIPLPINGVGDFH